MGMLTLPPLERVWLCSVEIAAGQLSDLMRKLAVDKKNEDVPEVMSAKHFILRNSWRFFTASKMQRITFWKLIQT